MIRMAQRSEEGATVFAKREERARLTEERATLVQERAILARKRAITAKRKRSHLEHRERIQIIKQRPPSIHHDRSKGKRDPGQRSW